MTLPAIWMLVVIYSANVAGMGRMDIPAIATFPTEKACRDAAKHLPGSKQCIKIEP